MRPSKRNEVLDAAMRVAESQTPLTIEGVAREAGLTKQGVMYHFPSRRELVRALQEHIANDWERRLEIASGAPPELLSSRERLRAYTSVAGAIGKAELVLLLEAAGDEELTQPTDEMTHKWAPEAGSALDGGTALDLYLIRMASDGLWLYESLNPMPPGLREKVAERLSELLDLLGRTAKE